MFISQEIQHIISQHITHTTSKLSHLVTGNQSHKSLAMFSFHSPPNEDQRRTGQGDDLPGGNAEEHTQLMQRSTLAPPILPPDLSVNASGYGMYNPENLSGSMAVYGPYSQINPGDITVNTVNHSMYRVPATSYGAFAWSGLQPVEYGINPITSAYSHEVVAGHQTMCLHRSLLNLRIPTHPCNPPMFSPSVHHLR
jgi:hypothetical protein